MRKMVQFSIVAALTTYNMIPALASPQALPTNSNDAFEFHALMRSSVPEQMATDDKMPLVHMLPDQNILEANDAETIQQAMDSVKKTSLLNLTRNTTVKQKDVKPLDADEILASRQLTMVIVPGFLGEFIETRGFEDVFSQPSPERDAFEAKIKQLKDAKDPNATDKTFHRVTQEVTKDLSELISVGSIKNKSGATVARVILLKTPPMSLESIGDLANHAVTFNRRLGKYLAITGAQDLAFVGYSRGTPLGLEMLAQAKQQNLSWLPSVKAMISLGGVTNGSSLADMYEVEKSPAKEALDTVRGLRTTLRAHWTMTAYNTVVWLDFARRMLFLRPSLTAHVETAPEKYQPSSFDAGVDAAAVMNLIVSVGAGLGLDHFILDYSDNVVRFQKFVDAMVEGITGLTTKARTEWWATHTVPKSVRYYTISAAMANPGNNEFEDLIFNKKVGYSLSADDKTLLQNSIDYKTVSGVALNDSQVAIAQAMILPKFVEKLNPENAGLTSSFLGTCGTHHWGLALRTVTPMKDGRLNPFPREALLKSLAAKVVLDQSK